MNLTVTNLQKRHKIRLPAIHGLANFFLAKSGKRTGIEWGEVSVALVNNRKSKEINRLHLGHDYPTDVISFNFSAIPGQSGGVEDGELVINVELAARLGSIYWSQDHELALYLAHGCDHLSGANDNTPSRRQQMRRRELRWLKDAKLQGLDLNLLST